MTNSVSVTAKFAAVKTFSFVLSFCRQSAVQAAAAAASQINQKLGAGNMNVQPPQVPMGMGPHAGLGAVVNIEWCVPDKMVGLSKCFCCQNT